MSNPLDTVIFDGKTSSDVFKEIYNNSKKKDKQINSLIAELKPLIQNIGDAPVVVPLIKEYLEIGVKNDEHLIKLATVIQRIETAAAKGEGGEMFDFGELQDLLEDSRDTVEEIKEDSNETEEEE